MKRGYKRLLVFEAVIFVILILNSFVWNILSSYTTGAFLFLVLVAFKFLFGFERDKHRYLKDLLMEVSIFLFAFFILYYLFGVLISFYKADNYMTFYGITRFILPTAIYLALREIARYMFMSKAEGSKLLFITTVTMFVLFDVTTALYFRQFTSNYNIFLFIALTLLPAISTNVVLSYYTRRTGYKPLMLYALVLGLYQYIFPIVPNPSEYILAVVTFMLPVLFGYRLYVFYRREHEREIVRKSKKKRYLPLAITSAVTLGLVYLTCGYFHFWVIAIASGSMAPSIDKGDAVIIEKIDSKKDSLKKGQVVAFKYDGIIVVHRLVDIKDDTGTEYFYTKGDANSKPDNFYLTKDKIIGVVNHKIPFVGLPTVWVNEL